jgi:2-methylcitrate dehydratase PrpD
MLLRALADRIAEVSFEALPGEAVATAKQGILDTVGVTLAGARDDTTAVVTRTLRWTAGQGAALIFGGSESLDALSAALINGTASHALDFDDCSNTLGGHPSAPILPALWTLATGVSGQAFIAAYAAGVETECKLARAVNFYHYDKGWHPTATLGSFGAAAACAHLLRLFPTRSRPRSRRSLHGLGHQGQFRHHDQAVPCRACGAQRVVRRAARGGGHDGQSRRARAQAGLLCGLQRRGQL